MSTNSDTEGNAICDAAAIIESTQLLGAAAQIPKPFGPDDYVFRTVTPNGWTAETHDLEQFADAPRRKRGSIAVTAAESLATYVRGHRSPGTLLYANPDALQVVAILNDHIPSPGEDVGDGIAGFRDHRATLTLKRTPGCTRWYNAHGQYMGQEAFAQMVEDGLTEIASPSGADLLELAQTMQSTMTATFRSGIRLSSGQTQFQYVEEGTTRAGAAGDMVIPEKITLVFAPFFGAADMQLDARLRYRIREGKLALGVWLIQHEEAMQAAFMAEVRRIVDLTDADDGDSGVTVIYGTP